MWGGALLPLRGVSDQLPQNRIPRTALPTVVNSRDSGQSPDSPVVSFLSWTGRKTGGQGEEENRWRQSPGSSMRATSAVIRDDPRLPGDPETLKLGGWVGVDGKGQKPVLGAPPPSQLELGMERQGCMGTECAAHTSLEKQAGWLFWLPEEGQERWGLCRAQGGAPQWGASWACSLWLSGWSTARS